MYSQNKRLKAKLIRGGIAPRKAQRLLQELDDHASDLIDKAVAQGSSQDEAVAAARSTLGDETAILDTYLSCPQLRSWPARWPALVMIAAPLFTGVLFIAGQVPFLNMLAWFSNNAFSAWVITLVDVLQITFSFTFSIFACAVIAWVAYHQRQGGWRPTLGIVSTAVIFGSVTLSTQWGPTIAETGYSITSTLLPPHPFSGKLLIQSLLCIGVILPLYHVALRRTYTESL